MSTPIKPFPVDLTKIREIPDPFEWLEYLDECFSIRSLELLWDQAESAGVLDSLLVWDGSKKAVFGFLIYEKYIRLGGAFIE